MGWDIALAPVDEDVYAIGTGFFADAFEESLGVTTDASSGVVLELHRATVEQNSRSFLSVVFCVVLLRQFDTGAQRLTSATDLVTEAV